MFLSTEPSIISRAIPSDHEATPVTNSPWAPLRLPIYRAFWMASLLSNLGTWVHEVGAAWLMTQLDPSPVMVSAVRSAMALPIVFLALPAGVLADRVDRRRLLLGTQTWLLLIAITLTVLTFAGAMTPPALLGLTLATGLGMVLHTPTWQASIPELVPRNQLISAIALGSISFNLARAAGPALGGWMVSGFGSWSAFALNALSFIGVIGVLLYWRRNETESSEGRSFFGAMGDGVRYVLGDLSLRNILIRVFLFVIPAGGLWGLLPLVARQMLQWDASGYGILVGMIGLGAVLCAGLMPTLRYRLGISGTLALGHILVILALLGLALSPSRTVVALLMLVTGGGWMMVLTTLNSSMQLHLPKSLRARGMGCYLTAFAIAMGGGSLLWGSLARQTSIPWALGCAGITLSAITLSGLLFPIRESH